MQDNTKCKSCRSVMTVREEKETQNVYFCAVCGRTVTRLKAAHRREFVPYRRVDNAR